MQSVAPEKKCSLSWGKEQLNVHRRRAGEVRHRAAGNLQHPKHLQRGGKSILGSRSPLGHSLFFNDSHRPWVKVTSPKPNSYLDNCLEWRDETKRERSLAPCTSVLENKQWDKMGWGGEPKSSAFQRAVLREMSCDTTPVAPQISKTRRM